MDKIRFRNYKCFEDTGDVSLKPLTFLLGANSSGKSSFLEFFPLLKQSDGVRRNGLFLWYSNEVDFKDFKNAVKYGEETMEISLQFDKMVVNNSRNNTLLKELDDVGLRNEEIDVKLWMEIAEQKDSADQLKMVRIEFLDECILLKIDKSGRVNPIVNGREFNDGTINMRTSDSTYLLPRIMYIYEAKDGLYSSTYPKFIDNGELFGNVLPNEIREHIFYDNVLYLRKDDYISLFKSKTERDDVDFELIRDLYLIANLNDIIEAINFRIHAEAASLSYVKPLRVMPERYYRYQNYAVDEIDSDGKNLAMFLANLSDTEMNAFRKWTKENFGIKIFPVKHEGHVELTIGDNKKTARNLVDVGFGFTQLLPIITIIWESLRRRIRYHYPRVRNASKIIAIEQPELHLHPRIQAEFAEVLVKVISNLPAGLDVRFVIETHSETIINKIGALVQTGDISQDKVNVVIFNGMEEGLDSYVVESQFDENGYLTKWPLGFFL